jgi:mannose-6-phosphate isomerase-like protein (cupin superfamily)
VKPRRPCAASGLQSQTLMPRPRILPPPRFRLAYMPSVAASPCPCGRSRRAFMDDPDRTASLHVLTVCRSSRVHYHRRLTELYFVLKGRGHMELDGARYRIRPGSAVLIKPGCRHRAVGRLTILNVPVPAFDPADEWFDDERPAAPAHPRTHKRRSRSP